MKRLRYWVAMAWVLVATGALAHRGHHTLSVVAFDAQGRVTVTHTLSAHDTEPELVALAPDASPSLDDPDALAALQTHLTQAFKVNGATPTYVSHAFNEEDVVFTYQCPSQGMPRTVTIDYRLFPASVRPGTGLVNVRYQGVTRSLRFTPGTTRLSATF